MESGQGTWELIGEISVDRVEAIPIQDFKMNDAPSTTAPTIVDFLLCPTCPSRFQLENELLNHIQSEHAKLVIKEDLEVDTDDGSNPLKRLKSMHIPLTILTEDTVMSQLEVAKQDEQVKTKPSSEEDGNSQTGEEDHEMATNDSASVDEEEVQGKSTSKTNEQQQLKSMPEHVKCLVSDEGVTSFVCAHCGYCTSDEATMLLQHTPYHLTKDAHSCHSCSFSARAPEVVVSHIAEVHSVQAHARWVEQSCHKCRHCPFRSAFAQDLSKHLLNHADTFRYHCSLCSFCAQDQKSVVQHEGSHFVKQLPPFQGIVRPTRKYQKPGDKTPFFLASDIVAYRPVSKRPPLTEQQKSDLRQSLSKAGLNSALVP
ncbi:hypothetical protein RvY_08700 [Ramazzottius varieornatus]|uniref:C2H2-type domain-containing protein n=1 Tax=Ramazzottius varieornatus TaxID=947166 RepID=A0A1D1VER9_RAMVA|nr:hypothetical protein RvY_08700 [Ramazzottius varieornatus]